MILQRYCDNGMCMLTVNGNSRLKILNDYELGLIKKDNITYNGMNLKLLAFNTNNLKLNNKCYLQLSYINKIPYIINAYPYNEYTPSHIIYPIQNIKQTTLDEFKINIPINIDEYEMYK